MPFGHGLVQSAIAATTTTVLSDALGSEIEGARTVILEVTGGTAANFAVDIQGKLSTTGTYINWTYKPVGSALSSAPSIAQLSVTDQTARYYIILDPPPFLQVVSTRTAGVLTVRAFYSDRPSDMEALLGVINATGLYVQGPAASDAAEAGNPVQMGGSVDDTSPAAAGEGDVRRIRVSTTGDVRVAGDVANDAADSGYPIKIGGRASTGSDSITQVAAADRVEARFDRNGHLGVFIASPSDNIPATTETYNADAISTTVYGLRVGARLQAFAPDGNIDRLRSAGDSGPGLGALNVAPIGGDITLRASAASGGTGTSTAVDNLGWVKSFLASLNVTVVSTGGAGTLDVWIQTQTALGTWTDIVAFTRVTTGTIENLASWGPVSGEVIGTQAEGAAVTVDHFSVIEAKALTATTVRLMPLGDSMRVAWTETLNGDTGAFTFSVTIAAHA